MKTFSELDDYLNKDYNINYWSDEGMDYAIQLLDKLNEDEWLYMENVWKDRSIIWQIRLADAVYSSSQTRVIELLIKMLKSSSVQVALAAAESLDAKDDIWTPDSSLLKDLERLRDNIEGGERRTIERLIARIPN